MKPSDSLSLKIPFGAGGRFKGSIFSANLCLVVVEIVVLLWVLG